jgi:hypothetical protein
MKRWEIIYQGKMISANSHKRGGWRSTQQLCLKIKKMATILWLEAKPDKLQQFEIEIRYRALIDPDNLGATTKVFLDSLIGLGVIPDDSRDYWKRYEVKPDMSLKHNTLIITLIAP